MAAHPTPRKQPKKPVKTPEQKRKMMAAKKKKK